MVKKDKDKHKIMAIGLAIVLALMLWIYVMGEKNPVQTRVIDNVKVSIENKDYITKNNLVLVPDQDYTVSITIKGRINDIIKVKSSDIVLEADMTRYLKKGDNDIPVIVKSLPEGISVSKDDIPNVKVKLDTLSTRFVPISISINGKAKQGYEYLNPTSEPEGVMISGPKTYLDEVEKVIARVNLDGVNKKVTKTIPVEPVGKDNKLVTNVSIEPKFVDITVDISPAKEVPVVVKTTGTLDDNLLLGKINSKVTNVKVMGSKEELDKIKAIETESFDITAIKETITKEVKLIIPDGLSVQSDIKSVGVEVEVNKKAQKEFKVLLGVKDKKEGFDYKLETTSISVKVSTSENVLSKISEKDINAFVDAQKLIEGNNTAQVNVEIEGSPQVSEILPDKVKVEVKKAEVKEE